jgi:hypothetical protein
MYADCIGTRTQPSDWSQIAFGNRGPLAMRPLPLLVLALAPGSAAKGVNPFSGGRHDYTLTLNSVTFVYSRNPPYGQAPLANYVTARAEVRLPDAAVMPIYLPYAPSRAEEELRIKLAMALPSRHQCTVPPRNIVISAMSRQQLVFRVVAPELCPAPQGDVEAAILALFGDVPREAVSGVTSLIPSELCRAGLSDACPIGNRCGPGVCNRGRCTQGRGDYMCECDSWRDPTTDDVTSVTGVRCELGRRNCTACGQHAHCSPGGCSCNGVSIRDNKTGDCRLRDTCSELQPCRFGSSCQGFHRGVVCTCLFGFEGGLCGTLNGWVALVGLLLLVSLPVCIAIACCKSGPGGYNKLHTPPTPRPRYHQRTQAAWRGR